MLKPITLLLLFIAIHSFTNAQVDSTADGWKTDPLGITTLNIPSQGRMQVIHQGLPFTDDCLKERVATFTTQDAKNSGEFFGLDNATCVDGIFIPFLFGHATNQYHPQWNRPMYVPSIYFAGSIAPELDVNSSTNPIVSFDARIGQLEGGNVGPGARILNRPLFQWRNFGDVKMKMAANGSLAIGAEPDNTARFSVYGQQLTLADNFYWNKTGAIRNSARLLKDINVYTYNYNATYQSKFGNSGSKSYIGLDAIEVGQAIPQAVSSNNDDGISMVDYNAIVSVLLQTVKEQQEQLSALEARIENLETITSTDPALANYWFSVSPNPIQSGTLTVSHNFSNPSTSQNAVELRLINLNGQVLQAKAITTQQGNTTFNFSTLTKGIYLVVLVSNQNAIAVEKIIYN